MKIGLLTGGGDCPGLNAAIRAVVQKASQENIKVLGILEGWKGLLEGKFKILNRDNTASILNLGGTILGGSRMNPLQISRGIEKSLKNFRKQKLGALLAIGGEGTLKVAEAFSKKGMPMVCIPKTIDNDTWGTDFTIGFDTAVQTATDAIDRLQTTAQSHHRVMIVEVMGRHVGWIATYAGIAGGAHAILTPEEKFKIRELCKIIHLRKKDEKYFSIFVVSEDAKIELENKKILKTPMHHDEYGDVKLGGIAELLGKELQKRIPCEVRVTVLGHVQRGGTPTAFDRVLATRLGVFAVNLIKEKKFGQLVILKGNELQTLPISIAAGKLKTVDPEIRKVSRIFFSGTECRRP